MIRENWSVCCTCTTCCARAYFESTRRDAACEDPAADLGRRRRFDRREAVLRLQGRSTQGLSRARRPWHQAAHVRRRAGGSLQRPTLRGGGGAIARTARPHRGPRLQRQALGIAYADEAS